MRTPVLALALSLGGLLPGQNRITLPDGYQTVDGNSVSSHPFAFSNSVGLRIQQIYDSVNFTGQGAVAPILVTRLRWRANDSATCNGRTYPNVTIRMSSATIDHLALGNMFASNHGSDLVTVFSGAVTVPPIATGSTPGPFHVEVTLTTPFLYAPALGQDLVIDVDHDGSYTGGSSAALDLVTAPAALGSRAWSTASRTAISAGFVQPGTALVMQLEWSTPPNLTASFAGTPRTGPAPLQVQFTDHSTTADPGGILSWAWDFDNDGVVDSTLPNPSHTYAACGTFTVGLTVTDTTSGARTLVRNSYIETDTVRPDFATRLVGPNQIQFTDTSVPTPTSWAWDLDGDGVVDSTLQNPTRTYAGSCDRVTVDLTVHRNCRGPFTVRRQVSTANFVVTRSNGTSASTGGGNFFDARVTTPVGVSICGIEVKTNAPVGAGFNVSVWATPDTYLGKERDGTVWRRIGTGTGLGAGNAALSFVPLSPPVYLWGGNHGLFVEIGGGAGPMYSQGTGTFSGPGLSITLGAAQSSRFVNAAVHGRLWNGALHYTSCDVTGEGGFGYLANGCAGSMGISAPRASAPPRIGQTFSLVFDRLPSHTALVVLGLERYGADTPTPPMDLTIYGATACLGHVRPDGVLSVTGSFNSATWSVPIPNLPVLRCMRFFAQAIVPDLNQNPFNAVVSDAGAGVVGN